MKEIPTHLKLKIKFAIITASALLFEPIANALDASQVEAQGSREYSSAPAARMVAQLTAEQQASVRHKTAGKLAIQQHDIPRALNEFRLYNQDQDADPEGLFFLAYCLNASGMKQDALHDYDLAEQQESGYNLDSAELRTNRGNLLLQLGRTRDAETEYRRALAIDPLEGEARLNLAQLLLLGDRVDDAFSQLAACSSTRRNDPRYCYLEGIACIKRGQLQPAVEWLRKCQVTSNQSVAPSSADNQLIIEAGKLLQLLKAPG